MRKLVFIMMAVAVMAVAQRVKQEVKGPQLFELGITDQQLYAKVGQPTRFFCAGQQKYVKRVKEVRFTFDHDMSASDAIQDIVEARELCKETCAFSVFSGMELMAAPKAGNPKLMFHPAGKSEGVSEQTPMAFVTLAKLD